MKVKNPDRKTYESEARYLSLSIALLLVVATVNITAVVCSLLWV
jgi:hypothetical protein